MQIHVRVVPRSKKPKVQKIDDTHYKVWMSAPPVDGAANEALIEALADFLSMPKSAIYILRGHMSRDKILEILS